MRILRWPCSGLLIVVLVGCSTIPVYRLPVSPPLEPVRIEDLRPDGAKLLRPLGANGHVLGDVFMVPPPKDLLAAALVSSGDGSVLRRQFKLQRLDVSIVEGGSVNAADVARAGAPIAAPPGAAILAHGLISLIEHMRHGTTVRVELSMSANEVPCSASTHVVTRTGAKPEHIRDVLFMAVDECRRQWEDPRRKE